MSRAPLTALCCFCLVLLLPVTATEQWCKNPESFKWLTGELQKRINALNENLLPSMVKYDVFTGVNIAELTDRCFIIITAQQLNNTILRLMSYFGTNSNNHQQTKGVVDYLTQIYTQCSDESSHQCLKPDTKIVTACRSDLFAYFRAVLDHYIIIFGKCESEGRSTEDSFLNFIKASTISVSSDCCLVDLHSGSAPDDVYGSTSAQPLYNTRALPPSSYSTHAAQTVTGNEPSFTAGVTSTGSSVVTQDSSRSAVTNGSALLGTVDGSLTQREFSNRGTMRDTRSTASSAAPRSLTVCAPVVEAGTASSREDKHHIQCQTYLYLLIGILIVLFLVLLVAGLKYYSTRRRMKGWYCREDIHINSEVDSRSFLETQI
uniref:uncharacterized protein isoform X2 n=1 Tax=Pristiophorus japonicus TaxID=55135 RepID=UPI00398EEB19